MSTAAASSYILDKPLCDRKEYQLIRLASGLKVLLVKVHAEKNGEANEDTKAAASLAVQVGSYADPDSLEGCAHFLEHMIFMGSKKYPGENEYDSFISSHGGGCNAYTEGEYTVYQFDITHGSFPKALDIFAHCFRDPLIAVDSVSREIKAIQNEFKLAVLDDDSRLQQVISHQITPGHVLHKFSWGNERSLKQKPAEEGVDSYQTLRNFYAQHYKLSQMTLTVVSAYSMEEMERLVRTSFESSIDLADESRVAMDVEEKEENLSVSEVKPISPTTFALPAESYHLLTRIPAVKNKHRLEIVWQIPPVMMDYESKSAHYLSHILGHECEGSLLHTLKEKQWAFKLSAGVGGSNFDDNAMQSLFTVHVVLTDQGLVHWVEVVAVINTYLELLRRTEPQKWIFDEMQQLARLNFDYMEEEEPEDIADRLAVQMLPLLRRRDTDIVSAPYLLYRWDPLAVQQLLTDYMQLEQAKIYLLSKVFSEDSDGEHAKSPDDEDSEAMSEDEDEDDEGDDSEEDEEDDDSDEDEGSEDEEEDEQDEAKASVDRHLLTLENLLTIYPADYPFLSLICAPTTNEASSASSVRREPHFDVPYWEDALPDSIYAYWKSYAVERYATEAHLPPRNPFVPRDFTLLTAPTDASADEKSSTAAKEDDNRQVKRPRLFTNEDEAVSPSQIVKGPLNDLQVKTHHDDNTHSWLYYCLDTRFRVPKVEIICELTLPLSHYYPGADLNSIKSRHPQLIADAVCRDTLVILAKTRLASQAWYMAELAGLQANLSSRSSSILLCISGFHEHALRLMRTTLDTLLSLSTADGKPATSSDAHSSLLPITQDISLIERMQQDELLKRYQNVTLTSDNIVTERRLGHLMLDDVLAEERLNFLVQQPQSVNAAALQDYQQRVCQHSEFHVLVQGNLSESVVNESVQGLVQDIRAKVAVTPKSKSKKNSNKVTPRGVEAVTAKALSTTHVGMLYRASESAQEENVAIEVYYQLPFTVNTQSAAGTQQWIEQLTELQLLELAIHEQAFDSLRTRQQLGYMVDCSLRETRNRLGLCLRIVSSTHSLPALFEAMVSFVHEVATVRLANELVKDESAALKLVVNLQAKTSQPDIALSDGAQRHWGQVEDRRNCFDIKARQLSYLAQLLSEAPADARPVSVREKLVSLAQQLLLGTKFYPSEQTLDATTAAASKKKAVAVPKEEEVDGLRMLLSLSSPASKGDTAEHLRSECEAILCRVYASAATVAAEENKQSKGKKTAATKKGKAAASTLKVVLV